MLVVLRGLPGSGKSTLARQLVADSKDGVILSADDFFVQPDGSYQYNAGSVEKAHVWCQERCRVLMERGCSFVVVDNCNLSPADVVPYLLLAQKHSYETQLRSVDSDDEHVDVLAKRNIHGVSAETIAEMAKKKSAYSMKDVERLCKNSTAKESKETQALREKIRSKLLLEDEEKTKEKEISPSGKIRVEVCKNDGQANPLKALVISLSSPLEEVARQACGKMGLKVSKKKCRIFDKLGNEVTHVGSMEEGMRLFISHDGKDFIPVKLKQTAAERREAKQMQDASTKGSKLQDVLLGMHSLPCGISEIIEGNLFLGSGRDGRDEGQLGVLQVDTIINVAKDWPSWDIPTSLQHQIKSYSHYRLEDCVEQMWDSVLPSIFSSIRRGKRVLVHCVRGTSRSAYVVAAYLMVEKAMSLLDALKLLLSKRNQVMINPGFILSLFYLSRVLGRDDATTLGEALQADNLTMETLLRKYSTSCDAHLATHVIFDESQKPQYFAVPPILRPCMNALIKTCNAAVFEVVQSSSTRRCVFATGNSDMKAVADSMSRLENASVVGGCCSNNGDYAIAVSTTQKVENANFINVVTWLPLVGSKYGDLCRKCFGKRCQACAFVGYGKGDFLPVAGTGGPCSLFDPFNTSWIEKGLRFAMQPSVGDRSKKGGELETISYLNKRSKDAAEEMAKRFGLRISRHQKLRQLYQFTYSSQNSQLDHPLVQECRGIVVEHSASSWKVVALPFTKFFNMGDTRSADFNWNDFITSEKLDGMMVMLYFYADEWHVATQSVPDGSNTVSGGGETVRDVFFSIMKQRGYSLPCQREDDATVFMFELLSPRTQVVVVQEEEDLVLIGARDMQSLEELDVVSVAAKNGWKAAPRFAYQSRSEVEAASRKLNGSMCEGFVLCDSNYNRLKVKAPSYVSLFHLLGKDPANLKPADFVSIVLQSEQDEVSIYFPSLKDKLSAYAVALKKLEESVRASEVVLGKSAWDESQSDLHTYLKENEVEVVKLLSSDSGDAAAAPQQGERMTKAEKAAKKAEKKASKKKNKK